MIKQALLVGLGGGIGSMARYLTSLVISVHAFPLATFIVNITGSFIIGCVMGLAKNGDVNVNWTLFLATGICGGFTTFSALSAENLSMLQNGRYALPLLYSMG